jgi:hypothetical protein
VTGILWAVLTSPLPVQPLFSNGQAHHVTLAYGVERDAYEHVIGLPVTVGLIEVCSNETIQAVSVALPTWLPCQNPHPHITISWADGAAPAQANEMLQGAYKAEAVPVDHALCMVEWLEWGESPDPRKWAPRAYTFCPTCLRKGVKTQTRSLTGYCRRHRPKPRK